MKVTLRASTGAKIAVWLEAGLYHARPADSTGRPEVCDVMDLFEVLAELSGLDLDQGEQAAEAMQLAVTAGRRLGDPVAALDPGSADPPLD